MLFRELNFQENKLETVNRSGIKSLEIKKNNNLLKKKGEIVSENKREKLRLTFFQHVFSDYVNHRK